MGVLLVMDNYDSFVYNLVQYLGELGQEVVVYRNDAITPQQVQQLCPSGIIISPGPGRPEESGICCELVRQFAGQIPILGVCLGHQVIGRVFGADVVRTDNLMHGKSSQIIHKGNGIFDGLPQLFNAARYHSLVVSTEKIPACLEVTAWTEKGEVMAISHCDYPVYGVQFHPESVLTEYGHQLLTNFIKVC